MHLAVDVQRVSKLPAVDGTRFASIVVMLKRFVIVKWTLRSMVTTEY